MHLNRDYIYDSKAYEVSALFTVVETKLEDLVSEAEISVRLKEQFKILINPRLPTSSPGRQCINPYVCEFFDHCNPELPGDHVSLIPGIGKRKVQKLLGGGIASIREIPKDFPLTQRQQRAVESVKTGKPFIGDKLAGEQSIRSPSWTLRPYLQPSPGFLPGMAPYEHIPFQWSVHRQGTPGAQLGHYEFLAEDASDPRVPFTESLCNTITGSGTIVVYNKSFEYSRLDDIARWLPEYSSRIKRVKTKLWDLLRVIRWTVYHPAFCGSFSLKSVVPAFLPEISYEDLEVAEGTAAGLAWVRFIDSTTPPEQRAHLKKALLEYCRHDALAMVKLLDKLRQCA